MDQSTENTQFRYTLGQINVLKPVLRQNAYNFVTVRDTIFLTDFSDPRDL